MRLSGTKTGAANQYRGLGDQLWDLGGARPTLDLNFAQSKSLVDATTGRNLIDFTRASSGTYVGSDGLIKTATTNLLLRSEELDQTPWSANALLAFGSGSIVNATTAPNGTTTADRITENSLTTQHFINQRVNDLLASSVISVSCYVKFDSPSRTFILQITDAPNGGTGYASLTLAQDGTSNYSNTASFSIVNAAVSSVNNGWYRVNLYVLISTIGSITCRLFIAGPAGQQVYQGDSTSGLYLWGAQLEQSSTVGEYVKTTSTINSAPRFDHDPTTGESLGLLVEESRTNLITYSEEFDDASWTNSSSLITPNTGSAPDGTATADTLISSVTAVYKTFTSAAQTYTASIFVKQIDGGSVLLQLLGGGAGLNGGVSFDFSTNTASVNGTVTTISSQEFDNGWHRISATLAATGIASPQFRVLVGGGGSCYIWGAQLEAGSFPTSYIPTEGSTATRAADVASISGSNFSSWYRQDEGTFFANVLYKDKITNNRLFFTESDANAFNDRHGLVGGSNSSGSLGPYGETFIAGSSQASLNQGGPSPNTRYLAAYAYKQDNFGFSRNGATAVTDTSGNLPTNQSYAWIGQSLNANWMNSPIARLTFWPARLPNETLQTITQ